MLPGFVGLRPIYPTKRGCHFGVSDVVVVDPVSAEVTTQGHPFLFIVRRMPFRFKTVI
jgi:hypothetical protein